MDLVRRIYTAAAREARAIGIHQIFTLVIEPNRDPRLGRNQEGFSEDPYLCARIAETIVGATQGDDVSAPDKVIAGLCHYPGQSQPASGFERGAMEISERMLREVFLPPWMAGIKKMGGLGVNGHLSGDRWRAHAFIRMDSRQDSARGNGISGTGAGRGERALDADL